MRRGSTVNKQPQKNQGHSAAGDDPVRVAPQQPGSEMNSRSRFGFQINRETRNIHRGYDCNRLDVRMHKSNSIVMRAPRRTIFETAANLELWPKILPHYRYIRYLARSPERNLVVMAARRGPLPISWTSEQIIDRDKLEVRFRHLKAFTKGMDVVWTFRETPEGVRVEIVHVLRFRIPLLAPVAEIIIGRFFVQPVANKTLRCMKQYLESPTQHLMPAAAHETVGARAKPTETNQ